MVTYLSKGCEKSGVSGWDQLQVIKIECKWLRMTAIAREIISQNTDDYGWLQVTTGSYERLQTSSSTQNIVVDVHKQIAWNVCEHV